MNDTDIESLKGIASQLRIHSIAATTAAGSGHPTSCCSAADLIAALFFGHMRYDPKNPHYYNNDRFILSKGHTAPLLYAAWAEAGLFPVEELLKLRQLGNDLEGHPTPRLPFVDVATGSLGQGLAVGVGMAGMMGNAMGQPVGPQFVPPHMQPQAPAAQATAPTAAGGKVPCPKCAQSVPVGKFCQECGATLAAPPAKKFCTGCGVELGVAKFCANCGTPAPGAMPPAAMPPGAPPVAPG